MTIHNKGGSREPYERYHTDKKGHDDSSRAATPTLDGLMADGVFSENQQTTPPEHNTGNIPPGLTGQWAYDVEYIYYCIGPGDHWIRIGLDPMVEMGWLLMEGNYPGHPVGDETVEHPYAFEQGPNDPAAGEGFGDRKSVV